MAIIEIKNGAGTVTAPYKTQTKNSTNNEKFELALSEKLQPLDAKTEIAATSFVAASSDKVVFTNIAQVMRSNSESSAESGIDFEKVARIKQAIENGTYQINPDRIAMKMMQFEFL
jgi:negative regulator of flagellin synthesis FlgM